MDLHHDSLCFTASSTATFTFIKHYFKSGRRVKHNFSSRNLINKQKEKRKVEKLLTRQENKRRNELRAGPPTAPHRATFRAPVSHTMLWF
jgi:hypothetical protein